MEFRATLNFRKFLKKILEKKRSERSSSGESSTSPDAKKAETLTSLKSKNTTPTTKSLQLWTWQKAVHKTLEEINRKLEKLDAIQIAVNDVQACLQKLEGRIQKLESSQTTANRDIENLTESFKAAEKQLQKSTARLKDLRGKLALL